MELLTNLGIDWKLLIAQIVNFGLLLWLLSKFLYKPIIRRIEKDETELEKAKRMKEELVKEREKFEKEQKEKLKEAVEKAQQIIKEAEELAEKIKKRAREEGKEAKERLIRQAEEAALSKKEKLEKEAEKELSESLKSRILQSLEKIIKEGAKEDLDKFFLERLIRAVKKSPLEETARELSSFLKEISSVQRQETKNKSQLKSELSKLLDQKLSPIILESATSVEKKELDCLKKALAEKLGIESFYIKIVNKENKKLISGFRLELGGMLFRENIYDIIEYASERK